MLREGAARSVALGMVTSSFLESASPPWKMNKTKDVPIYSTSGKLGGDGLVVSVEMDVSVLKGLLLRSGAYRTWHRTDASEIVLSSSHELLNISLEHKEHLKEQEKRKYDSTGGEKH